MSVAGPSATDVDCRPETEADAKLYSNAFHWGYSLVADPRTRFRYETRNIVGTNSADSGLAVHMNPESPANTVQALAGSPRGE